MNREDGRVENGTYDGDPSRSARFPHGAGALLAALAGAALLALGVALLHPIARAWGG